MKTLFAIPLLIATLTTIETYTHAITVSYVTGNYYVLTNAASRTVNCLLSDLLK